MLGEKVACATVSPYLFILPYIQVQCYPPLSQLYSGFGDLSDGVCHVIKITIAKSIPDMEFLTQRAFCFSPNFVFRDNKMPVMTVSIAFDRCQRI